MPNEQIASEGHGEANDAQVNVQDWTTESQFIRGELAKLEGQVTDAEREREAHRLALVQRLHEAELSSDVPFSESASKRSHLASLQRIEQEAERNLTACASTMRKAQEAYHGASAALEEAKGAHEAACKAVDDAAHAFGVSESEVRGGVE